MKITGPIILSTLAMVIVSISVQAKSYYDYANVIRTKPVVDYVTVISPVTSCHRVNYRRSAHQNGASTVVGALVGGVIGHAVGNNEASTVAGAIIGGSIAHNVSHHRPRTHRQCESQYESRRKVRKITGYKVKYRYHGETYKTFMKHHPGDRIKVRVRVNPARYN